MPSIGEKVKALRKHRNINQLALAEYIGTTNDRVIDIEAGRAEYHDRHIDEIKKLFDIVDMPLDDNDRPAFVRRLYLWRAYMKRDLTGEAVKMRAELAKVVNLEPCDHNLVMLYKIFEARMLVEENKLLEAENNFNLIDPEKLNKENLFQYYYVKGYISMRNGQYETCLSELLIAHELKESHPGLLPEYDINGKNIYYGIAWCYTYLEFPYRAISFLYKAKELCDKDVIDNLMLYLDILLAQNYVRVNELGEAEKLLRSCLSQAQSARDDHYVGITKWVYGCLHRASDNYKMAIVDLSDALKYLQEESENYAIALYEYIRSHICNRQFSKANRLLESVQIKYNSNEFWTQQFEALRHYGIISRRISVKNKVSCEYIENVAIPQFEQSYDYFRIVDYCELLESHYVAIKSYRNSLRMGVKIRDVYKRCFINSDRRA